VWIITGDGDGLSIGASHLLHLLRRNLDVNILLFNNRIYGLTKGQFSPTSELGKVTKTSPMGTIDQPLDPIALALSAKASFVARCLDVDVKRMQHVLKAAAEHKGTSFVEIYQNCNVYNDGAFTDFSAKDVRGDNTVQLAHGQPLVFGKEGKKGLLIQDNQITITDANKASLYDGNSPHSTMAYLLNQLTFPDYPVPAGVFRALERPIYEQSLQDQVTQAKEKLNGTDLAGLLTQGLTWKVT